MFLALTLNLFDSNFEETVNRKEEFMKFVVVVCLVLSSISSFAEES